MLICGMGTAFNKVETDTQLKPLEKRFLSLLLEQKQAPRVLLFKKFPEFDFMKPEAKDRALRLMKQNLIKAGWPVGSSHERGYFFILSEQDLNDAVDEFRLKATSQYISAKKLQTNFTKFYGVSIAPVQFELF